MSNNNEFVSAANTPNNNDFIDSLDSLTVDDVVPPHRKKTVHNNPSFYKIAKIVIVMLCVAIFAYCVSELAGIVSDYKRGDDLYSDIGHDYMSSLNGSTDGNVSQILLSVADKPMANYEHIMLNGIPKYDPISPGTIQVTNAKFQKLLSKIEDLRDLNSDTYGFISIPNTKINYPMVHRGDNDFYLTHAFDGGSSAVGAIFIDFRNSKTITDNKNVIIYGHNMYNGSMFCDATKFVESEAFFMNTDNDIEITTFDGHYTFRVFSAYTTIKYDNYFRTHFASDEDFVKFCYEREERSFYHREDMSFSPDDLIITLSTCILGNDDGRYAIHAKLIKVEK